MDELNEGAIELLSFTQLPDYKIHFVQKVLELLASVVSNWRSSKKINDFLVIAEQQQEELKTQEEELRQTIEEMQATKEEAERKEAALQKEIIQLKSKYEK